MTERLVSSRVPYIPVTVTFGGRTERIDALLDTGFEGDLVVPEFLALQADDPDGEQVLQLADGSRIVRSFYRGSITVGQLGAFPGLVVALGEECLMGLRLASRFAVTLDHGRRVIVEP